MTDSDDLEERRRAGSLHLSVQSHWCGLLGSPLYASLLERAAADCEAGGVVWSILEPQADEPLVNAIGLRFLGAVHRLVLAGEAAALARHYPSMGGAVGNIDDAWRDFRRMLVDHEARLCELARLPVQTNEVGRSAVLLGGFLEVARQSRLPLRVLEVGASAGLNLRWDRYRYEAGDAAWGDAASPVRFAPAFEGIHPPFDVPVQIVERRGCDPRPLDPCSEADRTTLRAYLWPDQMARRERLDGALRIAESLPAPVEPIGAADWLSQRLATNHGGAATVVFHSIVIQYIAAEERDRIFALFDAAGSRATERAPLAWLRFEPSMTDGGDWIHRLELTQWPGGMSRTLAVSSPHGPPVQWLATNG